MRSVAVELAIGQHLPSAANGIVAADVHLPDVVAEETVLFFCVPGGGMSRSYLISAAAMEPGSASPGR